MTAKKTEIPVNSIEALRRAKRWSMERLGEAIGTDASTINKLEKGRMRISSERLFMLAKALEVQPEDILNAQDVADVAPPSQERQLQANSSRMPVMGSSSNTPISGSFQISDGPVDWIEKPKALENALGVYALYVTGITMTPMFKHGSLVVASEFKPARIGDAVLVQERRTESGPTVSSIGILNERTEDKIVLSLLNPAVALNVNAKHVVAVHKILDFAEILGAP